MMMEWGTRKADELGLESWVEATPLGSMIYARHGFGFLYTIELHPSLQSCGRITTNGATGKRSPRISAWL